MYAIGIGTRQRQAIAHRCIGDFTELAEGSSVEFSQALGALPGFWSPRTSESSFTQRQTKVEVKSLRNGYEQSVHAKLPASTLPASSH